ncbi:rRNA processing protein Rrp17 [Schizosaccharomyces japonicus yFS275]|uniref:rRNA processing protein Rrp17 n=1 Tax=Schizosaccharomyces japonicus (strain yFS275 / FY16936) TaxID=402676 RepID=B6K7Q1_SCHJY|nr:rRNA processing protein Rrp17 [Schizosaccharomyces japonicus yFS275]EEB09555.1 rRNA processing protein Rrp17 [Schizosaccharomyces japonicus yFS275]
MDNSSLLTRGYSIYKKKRGKKQVEEEIVFDKEKRKEFLTGFHKRKLERKKRAQEQLKKQEREQKIALRKAMRDERKQKLQEKMELTQSLYSEMNNDIGSDDGEEKTQTEKLNEEREYENDEKRVTVTIQEGISSEDEALPKDGYATPRVSPPPDVPIRPHKPKVRPPKKKKTKFRYKNTLEL